MHKTDHKQDTIPERPRIKVLDGMRAFAILFVLINHSTWHFTETYATPITIKLGPIPFYNFLYNGWMGVDLFFVLSGFLITSQLLSKHIDIKNMKIYALRRFFRIAPTYYFAIFFTLIFSHMLVNISKTGLNGFEFTAFIEKWWESILSRLLFLQDYIGVEPSVNGVLWSVAIEIKFYLILPVFLLFIKKIKTPAYKTIAVAVFYLFYIVAKITFIYYLYGSAPLYYNDYFAMIRIPFHFSLDGLIIGVLCAFIISGNKSPESSSRKINNFTFILGLALFCINAFSPYFVGVNTTLFERVFIIPLFSASFGIMLIALVRGCFANPLFEKQHLRFIAIISYSTYLFHLFALNVQDTFINIFIPVIESPVIRWIITLPIFILCSFAIAYIVHILLEKPFIDWSKKRYKYEMSK